MCAVSVSFSMISVQTTSATIPHRLYSQILLDFITGLPILVNNSVIMTVRTLCAAFVQPIYQLISSSLLDQAEHAHMFTVMHPVEYQGEAALGYENSNFHISRMIGGF